MEGGTFTTICNLFSKIYFVTIYLSLRKENCTPTPNIFSKHVVGVIVSGDENTGKAGIPGWRAGPSREHPQRCLPVLQGEERGSCLPGAHWVLGPSQCLASLGEGGAEAVTCL